MIDSIDKVGRILSRRTDGVFAPPPTIIEPVVRLVYSDLGLSELFVNRATAGGIGAALIHPENVAEYVINQLHLRLAHRVAMPACSVLKKIELHQQLEAAGFEILEPGVAPFDPNDQPLLVTDCLAAIAETGSIVLKCAPPTGAIVVVEPKNLYPDLLDFFESLRLSTQDAVIVGGPAELQLFVLH